MTIYGWIPGVTPIPSFDPTTSILAGLSTAQLSAMLATAQTAYMTLMTTGQIVKVSYVMGDGGTQAVEYTQLNKAALMGFIQLLQLQLGLIRRARRPTRFMFT